MSLCQWVNFPSLADERGSLVALEGGDTIPFDIKRIYYIFNTKEGVSRGFHAHVNLKQVAVCLMGSCRILLDNGIEQEQVWLDSPEKGLLINELIWREMHEFSHDCVLLVMASEHYDECDYVRDYEKFKVLTRGRP